MIDTDATIDQALERQNERLNRLSNAIGHLAEALCPVLTPEVDGNCNIEGEIDSPLVAPVLGKLNENNGRIHVLYSQIFALTDRLAIKPTPEKKDAALDTTH